jgi:hypothetical protein
MASAYAPGLREATGQQRDWASATVRVVTVFRSESGELHTLQRGSGFVLDAWPDCVLTARHVVVRPPPIAEGRMGILLGVSGPTGEFVAVNGIACGYPDDPDWDVAVVLFGAPSAPHSVPLLTPRPADGSAFAASVTGYLPSGTQPTVVPRSVRRTGRDLAYEDGPALLGLSGGAVSTAGAATGIQSFDVQGRGHAIILDFDVLNECRTAAEGTKP